MREMRVSAGLSLREVARRTGVSATYISDMERGQRQVTDKMQESFTAALNPEAKAAPDFKQWYTETIPDIERDPIGGRLYHWMKKAWNAGAAQAKKGGPQ